MTRKKKSQGNDKSPVAGRLGAFGKRALGWTLAAIVLVVAVAGGLHLLERRILSPPTGQGHRRVRVKLATRPQWMPESLAARIAESLLTGEARYYDESLSETVRLRAQRNPWIREVIRVEKKYHSKDPRAGVVEVEASFRMPIAKARWAAGFAYFDEDGYRLPAADVPRWVATVDAGAGQGERSVYFIHRGDARPGMKLAAWHHVLIEGAAANLPAIGKRWGGDDVGAGLKLIKVISPKPYAWQITAVDVRNYGGRVSRFEPHLRMYAQVARVQPTDIRFGRFSMPEGDFNVSVERKLSYLDQYAAEHDGYLAGINSYLDLRYDELHVSVN